MTIKDDFLNKMILSASGWRGVFAQDGDEESKLEKISPEHRLFSGAVAAVFAKYLHSQLRSPRLKVKPIVLLGTDTRPTGKAVAAAMIPVLHSFGCVVQYAGVTAAPEIMAWAKKFDFSRDSHGHELTAIAGFIYISASHNPIGYNGVKFGLTDGGVLAADEAEKLITQFHEFINDKDNMERIESIFSDFDKGQFNESDFDMADAKSRAFKTYYDFCSEVVCGSTPHIAAVMKDELKKKPLGIVCDFNGSARTVSVDKDFFSSLGIKFESINSEPGQIAHRIVPEGESLDPCIKLLEEAHCRDSSFVLGYVPDCDGDRGNLVVWDNAVNKARSLEAQEVFALACVAEFSHLVWSGELPLGCKNKTGETKSVKAAVAINDPTSMRIDRIAEFFGIEVFRAEVGEANVVSLAHKLRKDGYIVRVLGEGSAGGNITYPSAVRDPISTVFAIAKMLLVRSADEKPGLFEIWCKLSGQTEKYRSDFSLADIIASLPPFTSTPAYSTDALLRIKTNDHTILKDRYQKIFLRDWESQKDYLKSHFGICGWEAIAYNKTVEKRPLTRFGDAGKGGLKILFHGVDDMDIVYLQRTQEAQFPAYIWLRGSATEPVFRIMADVQGNDPKMEKYLLDWQRRMIIEADGG